jgi:D-alanyl-D-alanine carboxypeptidase/D-alanyl-D-alanine-endopeptidase (penicillin-binding protein 4)
MKAIATAATAVLLVHALGAAAPRPDSTDAPALPNQELVSQLNQAIAAPGWDPDRWSVLVVSLDAGDTLFSHRPEAPVIPASNLKLFTTAAALHYLGPDYRYSTFLTAMGPVRNGVLEGDLYVYGTGDPTLSARFFESKTAVWEALADSLAAAGVRRIAGDLVGDASYFEGPGVGEGWEQAYVTHTYAAPASALSYNDNVVTMRVTAADEPGTRPNVQFIPGGEIPLVNEASTTTSGRSHVRVERDDYGAPTVLTGNVRQGAAAEWRAVPVVNPARFAVSVLAEILRERGITLDGEFRALDATGPSPITDQRVFAPATEEDEVIQVLAVHRSPPLQEILNVINQRSHNQYADAVLRTVGRVATGHGSVKGGEAAVLALLEKAGPAGAAVAMDDGSGLSLLDRASARSIVELLAFMADSPFSEAYMASLPEAATSRGLRRMQSTPAAGNLRAKTGTIDRVSALSGYVKASNGERLAFSIVANDVPSTWTAKRVEDRIGARLASFDRPAPARLATAGPRRGADTAGALTEEAPVDAERRTAQTDAPDAPNAANEASRPATTQYVIKRGDTLEGIARRNDTTVGAIREANPGVRDRRLMPGQSLTIPGSG